MKKNLTLLTITTVLMMIIVEIGFRVFFQKPWFETLLENQIKQTVSYRRNDFGLRDQNYSSVKPPDTLRILVLGDSFTQGKGVRDGAVFCEILEEQLNAEYRSKGKKIEILNAGIGGSLTPQWVDIAEKVKDHFQPDVILIVFFLRDGAPIAIQSIGSFFIPVRESIQKNFDKSFFYRHFHSYRYYRSIAERKSLSRVYSRALIDSYTGTPEQQVQWDIAKTDIQKIVALGTDINAEVGLVVFPVLVELNQNYPFQKICDTLVDFGNEIAVPTHSLLPAFIGRKGPNLWVSTYDQHPNELGHSIAAESITPFLRDLLDTHERRDQDKRV